jgi:hypothetical protein
MRDPLTDNNDRQQPTTTKDNNTIKTNANLDRFEDVESRNADAPSDVECAHALPMIIMIMIMTILMTMTMMNE